MTNPHFNERGLEDRVQMPMWSSHKANCEKKCEKQKNGTGRLPGSSRFSFPERRSPEQWVTGMGTPGPCLYTALPRPRQQPPGPPGQGRTPQPGAHSPSGVGAAPWGLRWEVRTGAATGVRGAVGLLRVSLLPTHSPVADSNTALLVPHWAAARTARAPHWLGLEVFLHTDWLTSICLL